MVIIAGWDHRANENVSRERRTSHLPLLTIVPHRLLWLRHNFVLVCGKSGVRQHRFAHRQRKLLLSAAVTVIGANDALHEVVAYDVSVFEMAEPDTVDAIEDVNRFEQTGPLRVGQVNLREVASDDRL